METDEFGTIMTAISREVIDRAEDHVMPLWLAREQLLSAFDREAERRDAKHIESLGGGEWAWA
ncbi:MAG TPA: hypothetical protein VJ775_01450 [Sphingomicrobium sp.]|nr:hypothetical protein [Sphingomicrobium sp.]